MNQPVIGQINHSNGRAVLSTGLSAGSIARIETHSGKQRAGTGID